MKVIKVKDYDEMSYELNKVFVDEIKKNPNACVSFTTGATPEGMSKLFVEAINNGLDISNVTMLNLDEYVGDKKGKYSVSNWMYSHIYDKLNVKPKFIDMFNANERDFDKEIKRYKEVLDAHPRDVQMLGLGTNGHIAANEPGTPFDSTAFVADSVASTIEATKNLFNLSDEETPRQMYTMGFTEIMEAKTVVLAASGVKKANAVKNIIEGEITTDCPASYLKNHKNFILIVDEDACSLLSK